MRRTRYNPYTAACPTRQVLDRIADKWTVLVIGLLEQHIESILAARARASGRVAR